METHRFISFAMPAAARSHSDDPPLPFDSLEADRARMLLAMALANHDTFRDVAGAHAHCEGHERIGDFRERRLRQSGKERVDYIAPGAREAIERRCDVALSQRRDQQLP